MNQNNDSQSLSKRNLTAAIPLAVLLVLEIFGIGYRPSLLFVLSHMGYLGDTLTYLINIAGMVLIMVGLILKNRGPLIPIGFICLAVHIVLTDIHFDMFTVLPNLLEIAGYVFAAVLASLLTFQPEHPRSEKLKRFWRIPALIVVVSYILRIVCSLISYYFGAVLGMLDRYYGVNGITLAITVFNVIVYGLMILLPMKWLLFPDPVTAASYIAVRNPEYIKAIKIVLLAIVILVIGFAFSHFSGHDDAGSYIDWGPDHYWNSNTHQVEENIHGLFGGD